MTDAVFQKVCSIYKATQEEKYEGTKINKSNISLSIFNMLRNACSMETVEKAMLEYLDVLESNKKLPADEVTQWAYFIAHKHFLIFLVNTFHFIHLEN